MKTRFDIKGIWINRCGVPLSVEEMETAHILNCIKMMVQKPTTTLAMLIQDIESAAFADVWTADSDKCCRESLHNVTSLSAEELVEYIKGTPLVKSMLAELQDRGVNTENILALCKSVTD